MQYWWYPVCFYIVTTKSKLDINRSYSAKLYFLVYLGFDRAKCRKVFTGLFIVLCVCRSDGYGQIKFNTENTHNVTYMK